MKIFFTILFLVSVAEARIFDMNETSFGGYFNANYGSSKVNKDYFDGESSATDFSKGFDTNLGGEFGFIYNTDKISWLFGLEIIKPPKVHGTASQGSTTDYTYTADVSVYAPKVGVELVFYQDKDFRFFVNGAVGTANLASKTSYSGVSIAPNSDFSIEGKGTANLLNYAAGGELHWTDNTTLVTMVGYRQLNFSKIKYLNDETTSFNGSHSKGSQIIKADGSALKYDFSNMYVTIGLRFWVQ
jgi:hypothetical protein